MTPADELQAAAEQLRAATFRGAMTATPAVAALLRARQPLADWLEQAAEALEGQDAPNDEPALAVARALLASQP
ncbi:hypothetical protein ACODT5_15480 [Streptomyces sp. 5.8]|uniref:hypothetical protein n=1 Tax=Streptomyces sp. 5.8 TaxID=3406571 RepID=UPI003BB4F2B0